MGSKGEIGNKYTDRVASPCGQTEEYPKCSVAKDQKPKCVFVADRMFPPYRRWRILDCRKYRSPCRKVLRDALFSTHLQNLGMLLHAGAISYNILFLLRLLFVCEDPVD